MVQQAGYIKYSGLPEGCRIKSECQLLPMRNSKYWIHHTPQLSAKLSLSDPETIHSNDGVSQTDVVKPSCQGIIKLQ